MPHLFSHLGLCANFVFTTSSKLVHSHNCPSSQQVVPCTCYGFGLVAGSLEEAGQVCHLRKRLVVSLLVFRHRAQQCTGPGCYDWIGSAPYFSPDSSWQFGQRSETQNASQVEYMDPQFGVSSTPEDGQKAWGFHAPQPALQVRPPYPLRAPPETKADRGSFPPGNYWSLLCISVLAVTELRFYSTWAANFHYQVVSGWIPG